MPKLTSQMVDDFIKIYHKKYDIKLPIKEAQKIAETYFLVYLFLTGQHQLILDTIPDFISHQSQKYSSKSKL